MTRHPQIAVQPAMAPAVEVDEEMVPLLTWLWDRGFETLASCQEWDEPGSFYGQAMVVFADAAQAHDFARWVVGTVIETRPPATAVYFPRPLLMTHPR